jgi:hypothetical protein
VSQLLRVAGLDVSPGGTAYAVLQSPVDTPRLKYWIQSVAHDGTRTRFGSALAA